MAFPYNIHNIETLDTPALVVSTEGVKRNIQTLISMIDDVKKFASACENAQDPTSYAATPSGWD